MILLEKPMFWAKTENLLAPFNCDEMKGRFLLGEEFFNETLVSRCGATRGNVTNTFGIAKGISRLALIDADMVSDIHFGGYAKTSEGDMVLEYYAGTAKAFNERSEGDNFLKSPKILMRIAKDFHLEAVIIDEYGTEMPYVIKTGNNSSSARTAAAAVAAIILMIIKNDWADTFFEAISDSFKHYYELLLASLNSGDSEMMAKSTAALSSNFYLLCNDPEKVSQHFTTIKPFDPDRYDINIPLLDKSTVDVDVDTVVGSLDTLGIDNGVTLKKVEPIKSSLASLAGKWNPHPERVLSAEEEEQVFKPEPWYQVPPMLEYACELYSGSYGTRKRINNFLLCGPSGTGKTEWSKMFSYATNTPIVQFGCSNGTESIDLKVSIIPKNSKKTEEVSLSLPNFNEIPAPEDMVFDPVGSYERITGIRKDDATSKECEEALFGKFQNTLAQDNGFEHVKSTLVEAFEKGWIVEIQEPTLMRPAVLASLNMMFDRTEMVQLIDGTFLKRHKDCVVIMTTNLSYEGCMDFNQSVLSRFYPIELSLPDDDTLIKRLEENTDWHDTKTITKMVKVYHAALDLADQQEIHDGAIDFRSLEDWVMATSINGRVWDNGLQAFINKCTLDRTVRADFVHCLESQFRRNEIVK